MEDNNGPTVIVHVDPSCPFAWITSRWLAEVERQQPIDLHIRLLSLSVVNEHRQLDDWYRGFNDAAWAPARVMAAVVDADGEGAGRRFYEAFGNRFHVALDTADEVDRVAVAAGALADAELPADLLAAATDARWDETLRSITRDALDPVGLDVGVPVVTVDGVSASGPVLSEIPRGAAAVALLDAVRTLAAQRGFVRFERQRVGELQTA
jgi:hypothetical protein